MSQSLEAGSVCPRTSVRWRSRGNHGYFCLTASLLAGECINCFCCGCHHYPSLTGTFLLSNVDFRPAALQKSSRRSRPDWNYGSTQPQGLGGYWMLSLSSLQSWLDCLVHIYCVSQSNDSICVSVMYICYVDNIYSLGKEVPRGVSAQKEGTHSLQPGNPASITASRKERRNSGGWDRITGSRPCQGCL